MGSKNSTPINQSTNFPARCEWCGNSTTDGLKKCGDYNQCKRCSGIVNTISPTPNTTHQSINRRSSTSTSSSSLLNQDDEKANQPQPQPVNLPLRLMHLLPFSETLPSDHLTEDRLLIDYLQPYFASRRGMLVTAGQRFQIREVDFKVVACFPPSGVVNEKTMIRSMHQPLHALAHIAKLHILPTRASLPQAGISSQTIFHEYLKPYFAGSSVGAELPQHHLALGDTFMSRGMQFKVVAATPTDGIVTRQTDIFPDGEPIPDIERLHILPIYESLPNNEKSITPEQSLEKYLYPFFSGRFQVITRGETLEIDGVSFKIQACEPEMGVVTMETNIWTQGEPLRAEDLRRQQELADEEMARRLQQQEARENGYIIQPPSSLLSSQLMLQRGRVGVSPTPEELRQRLQELLRVLPDHDPHRVLVRRLLDSLPQQQGAERHDIESLPTRVYRARSPLPDSADHKEPTEEEKARNTCMICLCEYEDGDSLRTLPCFHSFHDAECITPWLMTNAKCPVCRTPIKP